MTQQPDIPKDFKGKFQWLIEQVKSPTGKSYNDREIAEGIGVTANYVWRLRNDPKVNNPSLEVAEAIAKFFGVGLSFFEENPDPEVLKASLKSIFLAKIAKRAPAMDELSEADQDALLRIIDHVLSSPRS